MNAGVTGKIPKLDFLRAVSALIVIVYHFGFVAVPAAFGVLIFFVLSGFLITHLLLRENERYGTVSLKNFYIRRSLRIFPAFYVYWIVSTAILLARHVDVLWAQAICALFYVTNYYQGLHGYPSTVLSHTWSLGVEEQFYLVWPAVFLMCRGSLPKLLRGLLVAIPMLWVYRLALDLRGVDQVYLYTAFETRIDSILVGCALAIALYTGAGSRLMAEVRRARWIPVVLGLLAGSLSLQYRFHNAYRDKAGLAVDPVLLAMLIAQLVAYRGAAWMDAKPISYLGRISYSTYLYQQIVLPAVLPRLSGWMALVACVVATWVVAAISHELVEKPALRWKRRFEAIRVESGGGEAVTGEA